MGGRVLLTILVLLSNIHPDILPLPHVDPSLWQAAILLVDAKGVAGLGKAGGDGQGGSDKAGQQVPPEVYKALTYAGSLFLLTLSVPLILYGLNKLLNKIEECFGCGPSLKRESQQTKRRLSSGGLRNDFACDKQVVHDKQPHSKNQLYQNQRYHLQLMHQQPKYNNFTPLQEFDDGQITLSPDNLHHANQTHGPSPKTSQQSVKPFEINMSSDRPE